VPSYQRDRSVDERVAILEDKLAALQRQGSIVDDLAMFPVYYLGMEYLDGTALQAAWQNIFTPRSSTLTLGMQLFGDQVGATNTGGAWEVFLNGTSVANGLVPATFTIVQPVVPLDLSPYLGVKDVLVELRTRRTSGASAGGRYGTGGCIASGFLFARMS
jgi:hypothetical protein